MTSLYIYLYTRREMSVLRGCFGRGEGRAGEDVEGWEDEGVEEEVLQILCISVSLALSLLISDVLPT